MRAVQKVEEPEVLRANAPQWLQEYLSDLGNLTKRFRYRHPEIKAALKVETWDKCVYCESKIGHSSPGDVEHKIPSAKNRALHFAWANLTIACTECNRRKGDFYQAYDGFLDPYVDQVDDYLEHHGPIVTAKPGKSRGELFVETLELCSGNRLPLVAQKIRKMRELQHVLERYCASSPGAMREMLKRQLAEMAHAKSEYSAMVRDALHQKGYDEILELIG